MFRFGARSAIIAGVAIILTAIVWLVVGHTIVDTQQAAVDAARARAKATSILFSEQVSSAIGTIDGLLRVTARDMVEHPGVSLQYLIEHGPASQPNLVLMTFVDADGIARETEHGPIAPVSLKDREHIRVHLDAKADIGLFIGKPVLGRVSRRWAIQITRAVYDAGGLRGILVYSLDPQYFERFYAKLELENLDDIALVGMDGMVRMQARGTLAALAAKDSRPDLITRVSHDGSSAFSETANGVRYESYVHEIKQYPGLVAVRISDQHIRALVARQTLGIASFGAVITVLIFGLTMLVWRSSTAVERLVHKRTAELEHVVRKLDRMSHTDALTHIPNRRAFDSALRLAHRAFLDDAKIYALVIIDIDHFKNFNDTYGHEIGDLVLCGVATRLLEDCRKEDFVARVGGEEFAMILHGKDPAEAAYIARRLCDRVAAQPIMGHVVTISLGVAPGSAEGHEATYRYADEALYRAKEAGRNRSMVA